MKITFVAYEKNSPDKQLRKTVEDTPEGIEERKRKFNEYYYKKNKQRGVFYVHYYFVSKGEK